MTVTLKDLSQAIGLSVGTVSRALNDKSEVSPETAARVRQLAEDMGYVPNRAGRALSAHRNHNTIGVLLPSINAPFFDDIRQGVREAENEFGDLGIDITMREVEGWDVSVHLKAIEELRDLGCKALALCTVDDQRIRDYLKEIEASGIPVLLMNNEIDKVPYLCYVGPDYYMSGVIAGSLVDKCLEGRDVNALVVIGMEGHRGHAQRLKGFKKALEHRKNCKLTGVLEGQDNDIITQQVTMEALRQHPEINCIYMASGSGVSGLGAAVIANTARKFFVVACDEIYSARELVKSDIIDFVICQEPQVQGYQAIKILHEYLSMPRISRPANYIVENVIKLKSHFMTTALR
ncbi:LacI family DNA-binding transcriptional regulator [Anaerobiospirillum sp. NML120449]|uniref:LacI family DNA-binding transcriptional regulator n=1 Tax=Anaerobiospirillum sp. NML120449 TaxID=2932817 RepID=UPI001FF40A4F|nr:LacI family DNA-binding transcriptional regulator [Anaerobiospirillum sp. NML120449]MCK0527252.1 LacI family DNA-binding transcriptional regulator [Anaerobiospirillum sp. NML120449]